MYLGFTGGFIVLYIFFFYTLYKKVKNEEINKYPSDKRIKRGPYLLYVLFLVFFGTLIQWNLERGTYLENHHYIMIGLMIIVGMVKLFLAVKRLHDINMVGWWSIILIIPIYNLILLISLFVIPGTKKIIEEDN